MTALRIIYGRIRAHSGPVARRLRWPMPGSEPWKRRELLVVREGALGDVLMCTPALREAKRRNPGCRVVFFTRYGDLVRGLDFIDDVQPFEEHPDDAVPLYYEDAIPPRRHMASIMGDRLGLKVADVRPSCVVRTDFVEKWSAILKPLPRPRIVVNRRAGPWTLNKNWADSSWRNLIETLCQSASVIDISTSSLDSLSLASRLPYVSLVNQTSHFDLPALIANADLHIGPGSGPMHIAAAVGTPSVVIYGGYEHPISSSYAGNVNLYSPVSCSPCWLRTPCPYDKKCLSMISVETVRLAVEQLRARQLAGAR